MRKLITALALGLIATSAMADFLRTDCFGNVYDGDFTIPIGYADTISEGRIWCDELGNLSVGRDGLRFAQIDYMGFGGYLYMDEFDRILIHGESWPLDVRGAIHLKE